MTVLLGMSTQEQTEDNIAIVIDFEPINEREESLINEVVPTIPCTGCRYCVLGCPQHLEIISLLQEVAKEFD